MELNEFRNNTKVVINEELISSLVEGFIESDSPFYNQKTSLMACIETSPVCSGKVEPDDNEKFMNLMMLNMCYDKCHGKSEFMKLDKDDQVKMGGVFYRKIRKQIFESGQVVYDQSGVNQDNDYKEMEHEFIIKTLPENFIYVLKTLYEGMRKEGLDNFRIVTPSTRFICLGYNAPIKLRCNSADLPKMLKFLDDMDDALASTTMEVHPMYKITGSWYGYEQVRNDGITAPSLVANAVYEAIKTVMTIYTEKIDIAMPDGSLSRDYYSDSKNKYVALRNILASALENDYDFVMEHLVETTKSKLHEWNVNIADCLRYSSINEEVENLFGKELDVEALFADRQLEQDLQERKQEENPYVPEKSEEEKRLEELARKSEEEYEQVLKDRANGVVGAPLIDSRVEQANLEAKRKIEARKAELEEIISRGASFPTNYRTEEDMDQALEALNGKEAINNDAAFASKDYTSQLGASLFSVLNGADPEDVAKYNDALQEYQDLQAQEQLGVIISSEEEKKDQEPEVQADALNSSNGESLKNFSNSIDLAIKAIEAAEERERQMGALASSQKKDLSSLDVPDISRKVEPKYDPSKVRTFQIGENNQLNGFASGKTEVLTDIVSKVKNKIEESVPTDKSKKAERVNPYSYCLDYITEDDVLIPDLRDVSYRGNDLMEALRSGGNFATTENVSAIASHFGLTDYQGTREENSKLLDILRNLDKYEMDGTSIETGVKPFGYSQKVEQPVKTPVVEPKEKEEVVEQTFQPTVTPLDIQYNPKFRDSNKYMYSGYVDDTSILDTPVAGCDYTVLDYFLYYDLFNAYKSNSLFVLHEGGTKVTGKEFTMGYLIPYLTNYGPEGLNEIASYFAEEVLPPPKKGDRGR